MQFNLNRESLLKPLTQVINVIERRQTLPVLANVLVDVSEDRLRLMGTDLEVQMQASVSLMAAQPGVVTIPARKWSDIVRALPDGADITIKQDEQKVIMSAGRSRFTLATLPANDFPTIQDIDVVERVELPQKTLKHLLDQTGFAMAQQDVRFYLNGMLFDMQDQAFRCVATDGHRMALSEASLTNPVQGQRQIVVPRKGVLELQRLLDDSDTPIAIEVGKNHIRMGTDHAEFTSKLIDGRFPDYKNVLPIGANQTCDVERTALLTALQRAAILSNEKIRGVRLEFSPGWIKIIAHNPEQEEAVEEVSAETGIDSLAIGFNVQYLIDALGVMRHEQVRFNMRDNNSSTLLHGKDDESTKHVVMPLRI